MVTFLSSHSLEFKFILAIFNYIFFRYREICRLSGYLCANRFYIMSLKDRKLKFSTITHHASVTQCLGSIGGHEWYLGVAKASIVDLNRINDEKGRKVVWSTCGHYYMPPLPDEVRVFRIVGPKYLKLNAGTWHAGPLFQAERMDFYNLELSNTNVSTSPSTLLCQFHYLYLYVSPFYISSMHLLSESLLVQSSSPIIDAEHAGT